MWGYQKSLSHIDEICEVLGVDRNNEFAKEWHRIAKEFHRYAHRHGPYKKPREKEAFDDLWKQFEIKVLYRLVGNYLDLIQLVDKVLSNRKPTKEILEKLSNLLKNDARRVYFFKKLSSIEWFRPLKEKGFFAPERAPCPKPDDEEGHFIIPYWDVLDYLEKVSKQVKQPGNERYADELLEIIKDITNYHIKHDRILDNYRTLWFVKILVNLPNDKITDEIIDFIPIWLDSKFDNDLPASEILNNLLPKFLSDENSEEDIKKAEKIVSYITQIKWISKYSEQYKKEMDEAEPETIVDTYWLQYTFINKKLAEKVGEKCSENVIFDIADKLKNIFDQKYKGQYDLSYIWCGSMFNTSEVVFRAKEILTLILRDILLAKAKANKEITRNIIEEFLGDKYPYPLFKRLVLFLIGSVWDTYKDIFWKMLDKDKDSTLFNDPHYEAEVYTILQRHVSQFSLEEKEKIKKIIEEKVPQDPYPEDKDREYYQASWRQFWYSAMKSDEYFKDLYERYKDVTKTEEKVSFKTIEIRKDSGPSPLTKVEILEMPNQELAEYLKTFKTVDPWNGPTINGLADTLRDSAKEKPEKFINDLDPFLKIGYLYVYEIIRGIRDACKNKKVIDWGKLFNFIQNYIKEEDFWNDTYKIKEDYWGANHLWVVGLIGELVKEGVSDDYWISIKEHLKAIQEILLFMIDKILERKEIEEKDNTGFITFNSTLNSPLGKITEALILIALKIKQVEKESNELQSVGWRFDIKDKYDNLLNSEILESYVLFGLYLPRFHYLDEEWTERNIKYLETIYDTKKEIWEAFMNRHLFGREIYYELYILMRKHYDIAINYQFENEDLHDQLIRYICLGYLQGIEDINDTNSLLRKIIDKWKISEIKQMISFFRKREEQNEQIKSKIISFWRWIYENKYKGKQENELTGDDKKILSELCKLTVFLPEINSENFEWLKLSVSFLDVRYNPSLFIEYLNNLKDKGESVNFIGKIYLEMLKNTTPYFRQEDIQSIVEYLYQKGKKEEASEICNIYAERGYEFLKSLYEKYNR